MKTFIGNPKIVVFDHTDEKLNSFCGFDSSNIDINKPKQKKYATYKKSRDPSILDAKKNHKPPRLSNAKTSTPSTPSRKSYLSKEDGYKMKKDLN